MPVTREQFAEYLEFLLNDSENDHDVPIPQRLCVAVLSLLEYLTEDEQPPLIPAPLQPAVARLAHQIAVINNRFPF